MVSKCRRIAEVVAVMEMAQVSVTTRAPAALAMAGAGGGASSSSSSSSSSATASAETKRKRRRIIINNNNEQQLKFSSASSSSSLFQLKGRRRRSGGGGGGGRSDYAVQLEADERCSTPPPSSDELPSSCCSSNGSIGLDEDRIESVDLEVDSAQVETSTCNCSDEREMSPSNKLRGPNSEEEEEEVKPTEANNTTRCITTVQKIMPTELELEEFFSAAESEIQNSFAEKYNYDIVKDVPLLEGRYEWVQIKP